MLLATMKVSFNYKTTEHWLLQVLIVEYKGLHTNGQWYARYEALSIITDLVCCALYKQWWIYNKELHEFVHIVDGPTFYWWETNETYLFSFLLFCLILRDFSVAYLNYSSLFIIIISTIELLTILSSLISSQDRRL